MTFPDQQTPHNEGDFQTTPSTPPINSEPGKSVEASEPRTRAQKIWLSILSVALGVTLALTPDGKIAFAQDIPPANPDTTTQVDKQSESGSDGSQDSEAQADAEYQTALAQAVQDIYERASSSTEEIQIGEGQSAKVGEVIAGFGNQETVQKLIQLFIDKAMVTDNLIKEANKDKSKEEVLAEQAPNWGDEFTLKLAAVVAAMEKDIEQLVKDHNAKVESGEEMTRISSNPTDPTERTVLLAALSPAKAALVEIMRQDVEKPLTPDQVEVLLQILISNFDDLKAQITVSTDVEIITFLYRFNDLAGQLNSLLYNGYIHNEDGAQRNEDYRETGIDPDNNPLGFAQAAQHGIPQ